MTATTQNRRQTRSGRFYDIEGRSYPSVTSILQVISKPALMNWAAKVEREMVLECSADLFEDIVNVPKMARAAWITTMQSRLGKMKAAQKELEKAADIGSQTHALIEWNLKARMCQEAGPSPRVSDKAQWAFMAWEDWSKSVNLKPIFVEQVVYSQKHGYAGTLDLLAEIDGKLTVLDWKTGKRVYAEAHLQNTAYRSAIREMGHADPVAGMIVRLPKLETDPDFEVVEAYQESACMGRFLNAIELWTWQREMDELSNPKSAPVQAEAAA